MNLQQFRIFLYRYINNKSTAEENHLFDDFFETYQQKSIAEKNVAEQKEIGERIFSRIEKQMVNPKPRRYPMPAIVKMAAAVLLLVAIGTVIYRGTIMPVNMVAYAPKGTLKQVTLSDGTVIMLNADSKLTYPKQFSGNNREVTLIGEAFFKVARNEKKPFIVHTASLQTTVLGTSFNVASYKGDVATVTVVTGKVKVASEKGSNEVVLYPNQQAIALANGHLDMQTVHAADYTAWDDGFIYLKETTLTSMVKKLERKYNIHIQLTAGLEQSKCLFNGKLANDKIENVLDNLHFMSNLQYTIVNDSLVVINSVSCN